MSIGRDAAPDAARGRAGLAFATAAYGFWGFIAVYWHWLAHVPLAEVVAHRTLWSMVVAAAWLVWSGTGFGPVTAALQDAQKRYALMLSAVILLLNWSLFVGAIAGGMMLESSLGYFIGPLISIALGIVVLGERLTPLKTLAVGIAGVAVLVQAIAIGSPPWLALALGGSFAVYGYIRKQATLDSASAVFAESLLLVPLALAVLIGGGLVGWVLPGFPAPAPGTLFTQVLLDPVTALLLLGSGLATATPLVLFGAAAQRLPLSTLGLMQYIGPAIQFLLALGVFGEPLSWGRFAGFVLTWIALAVVAADALRQSRSYP